MNTDQQDMDVKILAEIACRGDAAEYAAVLHTADKLLEKGDRLQAIDLFQGIAERLTGDSNELPPLAKCHLFARLGGLLAMENSFEAAEPWLLRAISLADETGLSNSSRRDFRQMQAELVKRKAVLQGTAFESGHSTETIVDRNHDFSRQQKALSRLSDSDRQLIEWRVVQQLSANEIAQRLGSPREELLVQLSKAMNQFYAALSELDENPSVAHSSEAADDGTPQSDM